MKKRTKINFYLFLIVIVVVMTSLVYFKDKQMISSNDNPEKSYAIAYNCSKCKKVIIDYNEK